MNKEAQERGVQGGPGLGGEVERGVTSDCPVSRCGLSLPFTCQILPPRPASTDHKRCPSPEPEGFSLCGLQTRVTAAAASMFIAAVCCYRTALTVNFMR